MLGAHRISYAAVSGHARGEPHITHSAAPSFSGAAVKLEVSSPPLPVRVPVLSDDGKGLGLPPPPPLVRQAAFSEPHFVPLSAVPAPLPLPALSPVRRPATPFARGPPLSPSASSASAPPASPVPLSSARSRPGVRLSGMSAYDGASDSTIEQPQVEPLANIFADQWEQAEENCAAALTEVDKVRAENARLHAALRCALQGSMSQARAMLAFFEGDHSYESWSSEMEAVLTPAPVPPPAPTRKRRRSAVAPSAGARRSLYFGTPGP